MIRKKIHQKILSLIVAVALVATAFPVGPSYASPDDPTGGEGESYITEEVIVVYGDSSDAEGLSALSGSAESTTGEGTASEQELVEEVQELIEEYNGEEEVLAESFFDAGQAVMVTLPDGETAEEFIEEAAQLEGVQYVQKNYTYSLIEPVAGDIVSEDAVAESVEEVIEEVISSDAARDPVDEGDAAEAETEGVEADPGTDEDDASFDPEGENDLSEPDVETEAAPSEEEPATDVEEMQEPEAAEGPLAPELNEESEAMDDGSMEALATTNDTFTKSSDSFYQYYLGAWSGSNRGANIFSAWNKAKTNKRVTVAVLDTGVLTAHEDLSANLNKAYMIDLYNNTKQGTITSKNVPDGDNNGHGTHVAGIVAGVANNGKGIAGVSYNAKVLPIKVFNDRSSSPQSSTALLIRAYSYLSGLVDQRKVTDLRVINMSLGGYDSLSKEDLLLKTAIGKMRNDYGVLTVCAGGNGDSRGNPITKYSWPSDYEECLAVTSLDRNGTNSYWSDYNKAKDISAPGVDITSTYINVRGYTKNGVYAQMDGTSMASPVVAAVAALLWSYDSSLTVNEVVRAMQATAKKPNTAQNDRTGKTGSAGAVDALAAINYVQSGKTTSAGTDIGKCTIAKIGDQILVNGTAKPKLKITYKGATLKEGTDYSVEYIVISGSSTAYATAKGLGKYYGLKRASFKVKSVTWKRLAGADRYKTMSKILQTGFGANDAKTVIIATGENYPDALAASSLAGLYNAPIILTSKARLSAEAKSEIQRLSATNAIIVGSNAAVSSSVEKSISSLGIITSRVKGATRVETAVEIYKAGTKAPKKWKTTAIIASSQGFADALSISSLAYSKGYPIFLTDGNKTLTKGALSALKSGGFKNVIIVGSESVVSKSVVSQLSKIGISSKNVTRLGGADRYQTSLKIAQYAVKNGLSANKMAVATGTNFPDALAGAALCGKNRSVIFLVADTSTAKGYVKTFISSNRATLGSAYVLGSTAVVPNSLLSYLRGLTS